jgi:DNA (cytosine-5)-methyltransferase 1
LRAFYNENDKYPAEWMRNLIKAGEITPGDVDERSIVELEAWSLLGYQRAHFFAGIAGWEYALKLAGWPEDVPVWTGSCPCQPFSAAGQQKGFDDERHLWPYFRTLISECRPPIVFGEQVASKLGREWLSGVRTDLEALGYAVGAADLCAAGVGAPHIRQRLYWVAYAQRDTRGARWTTDRSSSSTASTRAGASVELGRCSDLSRLVDAESQQMGFPGCAREPRGTVSGLGDTNNKGPQGRSIDTGEHAYQRTAWSASESVLCADGKTRRFEPGSFPLAHGVSQRVGKLRAYGNAIVPQVAAEFIEAVMEVLGIAQGGENVL